jgi:hypothetical protein
MDSWQALHAFWSGFDVPAYDEQTVFDERYSPAYPHITYESAAGTNGNTELLSASLWDRVDPTEQTASWAWLKKKAEEIKHAIGYGGLKMKVEGGGIWIKLPNTSPFSRPLPSGEDNILRIQMNIEVDYIGGL